MKKCPECQSEFENEYEFCPKDGTLLEELEEESLVSGKIFARGDVNISSTINQIVDDESLKKPINVWVKAGGKIWDPVSLDTLRSWVKNKTVWPTDSVSYDGKNWKKIKSLSEMNESPDELGIKLVEMQKLKEISELAKVLEQQVNEEVDAYNKADREKRKKDKENEKGCMIIAAVVFLFLAVA